MRHESGEWDQVARVGSRGTGANALRKSMHHRLAMDFARIPGDALSRTLHRALTMRALLTLASLS